jgi:RNA polymerase sigma-70 factor (ECF subfamily)
LGPQTADEQLMLAFKSGDARAFGTLVARHRQPVFNFILRYVGHRQRAEDLPRKGGFGRLKMSRKGPSRA